MISSLFRDIFAERDPRDPQYKQALLRQVILVLLLGLVVRLFAFHYTYMINPDGTLYVHQARALYYGLWDTIGSHAVKYLSIYPILITAVYKIFGNWVIAAKSISIFFGTITLVPIYLLSKRFFNAQVSILIVLIFTLTPIFIARSVDIVREPICWFFITLGLYLFIIQFGKKNFFYLSLSCICFLLATWARIEAILFILITCPFILIAKQENKIKKLIFFAAPLAVIFAVFAFGVIAHKSSDISYIRFKEVPKRISLSTHHYKNLRINLSNLAQHPPKGIKPGFFDISKTLVWFIALGAVLHTAMEAFFYPFFVIFLFGLCGSWSQIKSDRRILYLFLLCISAVLLLYMNTLTMWAMEKRYFSILIIPSFIFLGFGIEKIILFLKSRFTLNEYMALSLICLLILVIALPKNLKSREADKLVFKEIGAFIASREGNTQEINILTTGFHKVYVSFYANLDIKGAPDPDKYYDYEKIIGNNYEEFVQNLKKRDIKYVLWSKKQWPRNRFNLFHGSPYKKDFKVLKLWKHTDTGTLVLLKLR